MATALITGASSGLGYEFAEILASEKYNLVVVARNTEKLESIASRLKSKYGIEVTTISADLSDYNSPERIYNKVKELGLFIDVLINNAGSGHYGLLADSDSNIALATINLNVTSLTLLTNYFLPDMVKMGSGKILNVSSLGAFQPDPFFAVYGATKAYELLFTESLFGELERTGVTVSALCPGPTKTEFATRSGKRDAGFAMDARSVALAGIRGMHKGKLVIIPGFKYKLEVFGISLLPAKMAARIIRRWQKSLK